MRCDMPCEDCEQGMSSCCTPPDEVLDREFAYTPWVGSCRDLYDLATSCRRPRGHEGGHAAGWGAGRRRW